MRKDLKANRHMTNILIKFNCKDNGVKFKLMSQKGKENWVSLRKKIKLREKFPKKYETKKFKTSLLFLLFQTKLNVAGVGRSLD